MGGQPISLGDFDFGPSAITPDGSQLLGISWNQAIRKLRSPHVFRRAAVVSSSCRMCPWVRSIRLTEQLRVRRAGTAGSQHHDDAGGRRTSTGGGTRPGGPTIQRRRGAARRGGIRPRNGVNRRRIDHLWSADRTLEGDLLNRELQIADRRSMIYCGFWIFNQSAVCNLHSAILLISA